MTDKYYKKNFGYIICKFIIVINAYKLIALTNLKTLNFT